jgi:hypothetical protein
MNRLKITTAMLGLLTACFAPSLQADDFNKETRITTNQPLQVQNTVLPPGQYLFKLLTPDIDENIVSIFSADSGRLEGTIVGLAAYRADASDNKQLTVSQPVGDQPAVLNYWFFPGDNEGIEFQVTTPASGNARLAKSKRKGQNAGVAGG